MAKLSSPSISITFAEKGASAIQRGERGIVALALKDSAQRIFKVYTIDDVPKGTLTDENLQYVRDALEGYTRSPRHVVVYVMKTAPDMAVAYTDMKKHFETERFDYMAIPTVKTDAKTADMVAWVKKMREGGLKIKAVLPEAEGADTEGVINWASPLTRGDKQVTPEQGTARIAGLLAGTGLTMSATYAPLPGFGDPTRMDKAARDEAVGKGKLTAFWDGEKTKLNRAVTSLTTTTEVKGDSFKKIRIVDIMDMVFTDIKKTTEDSYIGKYTNTYDNKCLLVGAVNQYFISLSRSGAVDTGACSIDVASQRAYLVEQGKKILTRDLEEKEPKECTDEEIMVANTGAKVFLKARLSILDAIEDVDMAIEI